MARIMDDAALQKAWREGASMLWMGATCPAIGLAAGLAGGFNVTFTTFLSACPDATTEWDGPTALGARERFLRSSRAGWRTTSHYRVLRLGHALAFGSKGRLSAAEVDYLRARGYPGHVANARRGSSRAVEGGLAVDFAFRYLGRRAGSRKAFALASTSTAFVERLDAVNVAPGLTLATRHGLKIPFRRMGDAWIRPVVSPSGDGFLDEDAFARACAGIEPWSDDPHRDTLAPLKGWGAPFAVLEAADAEGADASLNSTRRREEEEACRVRAGRLVSVDGVVHVPCPEPVLVPLLSTRIYAVAETDPSVPRPAMSLGWASGRLDCETDLGLVPDQMAPQVAWPLSDTRRWPTFPVGQATMARDVAKAYAERTGVPYREAGSERASTDEDPVRAMVATLQGMPRDDPTLRTVAPLRDALLKALRSGDVRTLETMAMTGVSKRIGEAYVTHGHRLVAAIAQTCASALKGRYEATRPFDEEADLAAMAP